MALLSSCLLPDNSLPTLRASPEDPVTSPNSGTKRAVFQWYFRCEERRIFPTFYYLTIEPRYSRNWKSKIYVTNYYKAKISVHREKKVTSEEMGKLILLDSL